MMTVRGRHTLGSRLLRLSPDCNLRVLAQLHCGRDHGDGVVTTTQGMKKKISTLAVNMRLLAKAQRISLQESSSVLSGVKAIIDKPERPPSAPVRGAVTMLARDPAAMAEKATNFDPPY